jgi:hypothetical protein
MGMKAEPSLHHRLFKDAIKELNTKKAVICLQYLHDEKHEPLTVHWRIWRGDKQKLISYKIANQLLFQRDRMLLSHKTINEHLYIYSALIPG